jgi:hypothetical protein
MALAVQLSQYGSDGCFEVRGSYSGIRYHIRRGDQSNIDQPDEDGRRVAISCFGPEGRLLSATSEDRTREPRACGAQRSDMQARRVVAGTFRNDLDHRGLLTPWRIGVGQFARLRQH